MTDKKALDSLYDRANQDEYLKSLKFLEENEDFKNIIENSLKALDIYKELFPITLTEIQGQKCIRIPADDIRRSDILVPINDEAYNILKEALK